MGRSFRPSDVVPAGLMIEDAAFRDGHAVMLVRSRSPTATCPGCGRVSGRIHSRYQRRLGDLPIGGQPMRLVVTARRFRCDALSCGRRIFTERIAATKPWARRTARLDALAHHLALALGGRPAESFAKRLQLPLSRDTLLRLVRRQGAPSGSMTGPGSATAATGL